MYKGSGAQAPIISKQNILIAIYTNTTDLHILLSIFKYNWPPLTKCVWSKERYLHISQILFALQYTQVLAQNACAYALSIIHCTAYLPERQIVNCAYGCFNGSEAHMRVGTVQNHLCLLHIGIETVKTKTAAVSS